MKLIIPVLLACATLLTACGGIDARTAKRIAELEDSLKVYRDSLNDYEGKGWTFNSVALVAKLSNEHLELGDSLRVQLFLAAGNSDESSFRTHPVIELGQGFEEVSIAKIGSVGWGFSILPTCVGRDSITGISLIPTLGDHKDTLKNPFTIYYNVTLPPDAPLTVHK
jgi:hypothetical protein